MTGVPRRLAVAVSGAGRSLENLLSKEKNSAYRVAAVIASSDRCRAYEIAKKIGVEIFLDPFRGDQQATAIRLEEFLRSAAIDWVALAGFVRKFPVLSSFEHRVVNIHPALLPKFGGPGMYGDRVHAAVIAAGESISGATIHFVNDRYDSGEIIAQGVVELSSFENASTLKEKVFQLECELYPSVLERLMTDALPRGAIARYRYDGKLHLER